jgi:MoxR-like ATPase
LRLKGETGTGKTTLVHRLAEILDTPLFEVGLTRNITSWDLLGCDTLKSGNTELRKGIILQWLEAKEGILYLDGFNYADPSMICLLESLADFRGSVWIPELGKTFVRSEKHYLVISYNPSEKAGYSGTFLENIATIRRFEGLVVDYLSAIQERTLIKEHSKNYDFAVKFVEIGRKTRQAYKDGKLRTPLTTGNLINYAKMFKRGLAEDDIITIASSLFPDEEVALFRSFYEESGEIDVERLKSKKN